MGATLQIAAIDTPSLTVGPIRVAGGSIVEVALPEGWRPAHGNEIKLAWSRDARAQGVALSWAVLPEVPRAVLFYQLFPRSLSVGRRVARQTGLSPGALEPVFQRASLDPEQPITGLDWTTRTILGFEIAALGAQVVVFEEVGLDPLGERRFFAHVRRSLEAQDVGLVALRPAARVADSPWAESRVEVTIRAEGGR